MSDRIYVGHPKALVDSRYVTLPKAFDGGIRVATALKRRGRRNYKVYVRPIRRDGRIVAWAVLRRMQ